MFSTDDTKKIKGIAIIMMLLHHCFLSPARYEGQEVDFSPFTESFANQAALSMKICVAIFVFISAYGITISYKKATGGDLSKLSPGIVRRSIYRRGVKMWMNYFFIFMLAQLYSVLVMKDGRYTLVYGEGGMSIVYFLTDMAGLAKLFCTPNYIGTFWYISLAWLIIFTMPLFLAVYSKFGGFVMAAIAVLIPVFLPVTDEVTYAFFPDYAAVIAAGIISADKDLVVRTANIRIFKPIKLAIYLALLYGLMAGRHIATDYAFLSVWDAAAAFLICVSFYEFFNRWPVIKEILSLIGKYATDIFLMHNFVRIIWYYDFTYSFRRWWLIALVLLLISLAVSVVIELLKKYSGFNKLIDKMLAPGSRQSSAERI